MRALITGGKGFVGSGCRHLQDCGDDVAVIDIETTWRTAPPYAGHERGGAEAIYHLAA